MQLSVVFGTIPFDTHGQEVRREKGVLDKGRMKLIEYSSAPGKKGREQDLENQTIKKCLKDPFKERATRSSIKKREYAKRNEIYTY